MSVEFRCQYGSADLCMNGGTCAELNLSLSGQTIETCACPQGYIHDYFGAHFNNCSFPENGYLAILVAFSILFTICLCIAARFFIIIKGWPLRRLLLILIGCIICEWSKIIAIYVDNGAFEVANVFTGIDTFGMGALALEGAAVLLVPLNMLNPELLHRMRRNVIRTEICMALGACLCFVALAATCRLQDQGVYNAIYAAMLAATIFQMVAVVIVVSRAMSRLEHRSREAAAIFASSKSQQTPTLELADRLHMARLTLVRTTIFQVIPIVPLPILIAVLGSIPYMWVFELLLVSVNVGVTVVISILVAKQQSIGIARIFCCASSSVKVPVELSIDPKEREVTASASGARKLLPFLHQTGGQVERSDV